MTMHLPHPFVHEQARENTVLDVSEMGPGIEDAVRAVMDQPRLRLVGFRCSVSSGSDDPQSVAGRVDDVIGLMEQVRRDYGVILTELMLLDADPTGIRDAVDDGLDEACARNRYPRPTVVFAGTGAGVSALTRS
ncbi:MULTISPECIES: decarboxylase [unclassified Rhodococcus (in: high G+C Gram-positive bacteria)]|uniref:decarboxylase n=1 Tax=unclassified Rhodococcus (in: high G+C Gram-positive bacteria) TaxID=192944 RepID=UPI00163AADC1|nr:MULTISPECIES: decarboxylase [unclassified Rhodococcus (in: high G+C Gram-positive bacteria)]MBC2640475.1 decarboxylase [Rhodococcus sp. 3A]MBC2894779.1 decarboxylase [Rhodococcus sp. 4CII]